MVKRIRGSNLNIGEMVISAIKKLMRNTGWTSRTIIKFIKMEYGVSDPKISRKVSRALKRGVKLGLLQNDTGRYRLGNMSHLTGPPKPGKVNPRRERPLRVRSRSPSYTRARKYHKQRY